MTRDEEVLGNLSVVSKSINMALKKLKTREYVMLKKYLILAQLHVKHCVELVKNGKNEK